jgi:hypothetical protein
MGFKPRLSLGLGRRGFNLKIEPFNPKNPMALYPNTPDNRTEPAGDQFPQSQSKPSVPPAKIDEILLEALDALEQTHKLHDSTANPETKRQTKRILTSLLSSLIQLATLGIHSVGRLERLPMNP